MIEFLYSQWFNGDINPSRIGVYQRRNNGFEVYSYWDGKKWCLGANNAKSAFALRCWEAKLQICDWRGLARDYTDYA